MISRTSGIIEAAVANHWVAANRSVAMANQSVITVTIKEL
jgi:hypothetical protein